MPVPTIALKSGTQIPQLGLGVWQVSPELTASAVRYAIAEAGYRHIDTASAYGNEQGVGQGLVASGVDRGELFVTTKLWNSDQGYEPALRAIDISLRRLGTDYVDLYLIHWPLLDKDRLLATWEAMEKIADSGKARAIGVCNFEPHHLQLLIDRGGVLPAVNQVELNPHLPQKQLRAFCADHGIAVESWSPLGGTHDSGWGVDSKPNTLLNDPILGEIAEKHGRSIAQIILAWHVHNGLIVIPKSVHNERISENIDVFDIVLDAEDVARIDGLDDGTRIGMHPDEMNIGAPE